MSGKYTFFLQIKSGKWNICACLINIRARICVTIIFSPNFVVVLQIKLER
jgi:hypothetical protein